MAPSIHPVSSRQKPAGADLQARVVEVFSSIQGEGPQVGRRHVFVRFFACNIRCRYCDTPESLTGEPPARLQISSDSQESEVRENPVSLDELVQRVQRLAEAPHDAVSLTGGEPLLHRDFLQNFCPEIRRMGLPVYLETNGTLPQHLEAVRDLVDVVSMDIKLPETLQTQRDWMGVHEEFLNVALGCEVFCKMVLSADPNWQHIDSAFAMVARVSADIPFIIQPLTPFGDMTSAPSSSEIIRAYEMGRKCLRDVRVIPQTHKMIGLR